jgi:hypothetical protein
LSAVTAIDPHDAAVKLRGEVGRDQHGALCVHAPGPGHKDPLDRSMSVALSDRYPEGFLVFGHAKEGFAELRDYVRAVCGLPPRSSARMARTPWKPPAPPHGAPDRPQRPGWLRLWRQGLDPAGTPVELYLRRRGVSLPDAGAGVIRWSPRCPFGDRRSGVMLALVRSIETDQPVAVHRTEIMPPGATEVVLKPQRMALGPVRAATIKLCENEEVSTCLGVGEGIETTLSMRLVPGLAATPIWALIDAGHLQEFPVLQGIKGLIIAIDNDRSRRGDEAAAVVTERYRRAGAEVTHVRPPKVGDDLNDLVRRS